ncbi:hypothetical protein ND748_08575 [Frankia sp. AiPs1]|uniref:hypothetical protein n=1 Tax=Frankia sp. AiPs1 TaxID=573493 RepID=UPI002044630F|nr:hypothetical protein [Frankia sp. AiPs1]MCM3921717.1 hypothetical protein [Frankia sp. AiPs1]
MTLTSTRLTPMMRAAVMIRLCHELGEGRPATREQIIRDLYGAPIVANNADTPTDVAVTLAPEVAPVFVAPTVPDHQDVIVDQEPDIAVSFADAAARLGLSIGTVRRYCAPSSGKLLRVGIGVSLASVDALAG